MLKLLSGLAQHSLLLVTLNHTGKGLPKDMSLIAAVATASVLISLLRWQDAGVALTFLISLLIFLYLGGKEVLVAYSLISINMDLLGIFGLADWATRAWEIGALVSIWIRIAFLKRQPNKEDK